MNKKQWDNTTELLKGLAKSGCSKCYGRGYIGREVKRDILIPCKCVDKEELKKAIMEQERLVRKWTM